MYLVPNKISGNSIPHFAKRDKEKKRPLHQMLCAAAPFRKVSGILFQFQDSEASPAAGLEGSKISPPLPPGPPLLPPPDT